MKKPIVIAAVLVTLSSALIIEADVQAFSIDTISSGPKEPIEVFNQLNDQYGSARLVLKDKSIYKRVIVHELNSIWLVFIKDGSLHDIMLEKISYIQYGSKYGPKVRFDIDNKIVISF